MAPSGQPSPLEKGRDGEGIARMRSVKSRRSRLPPDAEPGPDLIRADRPSGRARGQALPLSEQGYRIWLRAGRNRLPPPLWGGDGEGGVMFGCADAAAPSRAG